MARAKGELPKKFNSLLGAPGYRRDWLVVYLDLLPLLLAAGKEGFRYTCSKDCRIIGIGKSICMVTAGNSISPGNFESDKPIDAKDIIRFQAYYDWKQKLASKKEIEKPIVALIKAAPNPNW